MTFTNFSFTRAAGASDADIFEDADAPKHPTDVTQEMIDALGDSTRAAQVLRCRIVDGVGDHHENIRLHAAACSHTLDKLDELAELIRFDLEDFAR